VEARRAARLHRSAGRDRQPFDRLRVNYSPAHPELVEGRHPEAAEFRRAWDAALDIGLRRIEDVAMDRAINGVEVPVYSYGKLVGTRVVYNDRLVMFMLRNRLPGRFAGGRPKALNAADKETVRKLKQQWRAEWERDAAIAASARHREEGDSLLATIEQMHRRWFCAMSPATRAAYRAFREVEDADDRAWLHQADPEATLRDAEAEYEEWFGAGADDRAPVAKLVDMRAWQGAEAKRNAEADRPRDDRRDREDAAFEHQP
jgi:hypothetical protein